MSKVTVTLPDGSTRSIPPGTTVLDIAEKISSRLAKEALAAFVNDRMVDLSHALEADAKVQVVTPKSPEALDLYRHSTAHLMAAAGDGCSNFQPAVGVERVALPLRE